MATFEQLTIRQIPRRAILGKHPNFKRFKFNLKMKTFLQFFFFFFFFLLILYFFLLERTKDVRKILIPFHVYMIIQLADEKKSPLNTSCYAVIT